MILYNYVIDISDEAKYPSVIYINGEEDIATSIDHTSIFIILASIARINQIIPNCPQPILESFVNDICMKFGMDASRKFDFFNYLSSYQKENKNV